LQPVVRFHAVSAGELLTLAISVFEDHRFLDNEQIFADMHDGIPRAIERDSVRAIELQCNIVGFSPGRQIQPKSDLVLIPVENNVDAGI
jgi:hypothetical protein